MCNKFGLKLAEIQVPINHGDRANRSLGTWDWNSKERSILNK